MHVKRKPNRKRQILLLGCVGMLLISAICFTAWQWLSNLLESQKMAERWQGDGEMAFSQISCFLPSNEEITLENVSSFRSAAMKAMEEASLDVKGSRQFMIDAWSTTTRLYTSGQHGRGEVNVIAVGGNYFDFHPLRLLSGNYLRQTDLMDDRILLSEDVAWLLFGGTDLHGMTMKLDGVPFMIAGVVAQEDDFATKKSAGDGMDLFMSYDGLLRLREESKLSCYEYVMAEPVRNFALNVAKQHFSIGDGEIICNTTRYRYGKMMDLALAYGLRGVQRTKAIYPYWENAARITENWGSLCCFFGTLFFACPAVIGAVWLLGATKRGKEKLEDDILPDLREKSEEAVRKRQRKRWERQHGVHEKDA